MTAAHEKRACALPTRQEIAAKLGRIIEDMHLFDDFVSLALAYILSLSPGARFHSMSLLS